MMGGFQLVTLAIISLAAGSTRTNDSRSLPLAAVHGDGTITVSEKPGAPWAPIYQCASGGEFPVQLPDGPTCTGEAPRATVAWVGDSLYMACGHRLLRWRAASGVASIWAGDKGGEQILALSGGQRLSVATRDGRIFRAQDGERLQKVVRAPELPRALIEVGGELYVAGAGGIWSWQAAQSDWHLVAPVKANGFAAGRRDNPEQAVLWVAGEEGLFVLTGRLLRAVATQPVCGLAAVGSELWLATGERIVIMTTPLPGVHAERADDVDPLAAASFEQHWQNLDKHLQSRRRWTPWIPELSTGIRLRRQDAPAQGLAAWIWLTWSSDAEVQP